MKPRESRMIVISCLLIACCTLPSVAAIFRIGVNRERKVGAEAAGEIERSRGVILLNGPAAQLVNQVGQKLVNTSGQHDFDFTFYLVDVEPKREKEQLINAFALPGGYIYIFKDMREVVNTEDELAAVLAHEITHVTEHHWARQQANAWERDLLLTLGLGLSGASRGIANAADLVNFATTQRYSRKHEQAADDTGIRLMAKAGYDPRAMATMLKALSEMTKDEPKMSVWMSDHPRLKERVQRAERAVRELEK